MRYVLPTFFLGIILSASAISAEPDLKQIRSALAKAFPNTPLDSLKPSPVHGLYELVADTQVYYVSADGKFILVGDLVEIGSRVNLTEKRREKIVVRLLDQVGEQNMIVMGPKNPKRTITVFTDVDCPYCAKLHLDVPELNKQGVKVRYLLFPRMGLQSETYKRSVAVWCAPDRAKAVGIAKARGKLDMKTCKNPVKEHYQLGLRLGVSGTPTIFLGNGKKIVGYVPPDRLLTILGIQSVSRAAVR